MPFHKHGRRYDLVVFGATGYTGKYTAEHITTSLPTDLKWAIAGRSQEKLEKLAAEIKPLNPDRRQPEIEICELNDEHLDALAKKTFILITTVGPYGLYGEHAFKACAENGTHYLDVTGEVPFVARMIKKYEQAAKQSGSMLIPEIGIESAPADLITFSLAKHNRAHLNADTGEVVLSVHALDAMASGGTLATVLGFFDMFSLREITDSMKQYAISPVPNPKAAAYPRPLTQRLTGTRYVPSLGVLSTCVAGDSDRAIVERTWGLFSSIPAKKSEFYGPNFRFSEHLRVRNWLYGLLVHLGINLASILFVTLPPLRRMLKKLVYAQGQGPDVEQAKKHKIEYRAIGKPDGWKENDKVAFCRAYFNGSMYDLTGIFLAQAALTILEDNVEDLGGGGIFTPACLGQGLVDRVDAAGFKFETKTTVA
ncbi:unnamed protein product [Discula destructiva]